MVDITTRARKKAAQSDCTMKVAALGFNRNGDCVASATNQHRFDRKQGGLHAEERLFRVAQQKGIVKILICRVNNKMEFLPIDPCAKCQAIAQKLNIKIETIQGE